MAARCSPELSGLPLKQLSRSCWPAFHSCGDSSQAGAMATREKGPEGAGLQGAVALCFLLVSLLMLAPGMVCLFDP